MKKILSFAAVLSVLALVACGSSSTSSAVEHTCTATLSGKVVYCLQLTQTVNNAACKAQAAADMGLDTTQFAVAATSASCTTGFKDNCSLLDSNKAKIFTFYGYDSTATAMCTAINSIPQ